MVLVRAVVITASVLSPCLAGAQTLDEKTIEQSIAMGKANAFDKLLWRCTAKRVQGSLAAFGVGGVIGQAIANAGKASFDVAMMGHRGRIAVGAWNAGRSGQLFTRASVLDEWLESRLFVLVEPNLPDEKSSNSPILPETIKTSVFREFPGKKILLTPLQPAVNEPRTWRNSPGASLDYAATWLTFDAAAFGELYSSTEIQFAIASDTGERAWGYVPMRTVRNTLKAS